MRLKASVLMGWGCLALSVGCGGPDVPGAGAPSPAALGRAGAALEEGLGAWQASPSTSALDSVYSSPVRLKSGGEVLAVSAHKVARYNSYNDTWRAMNDACPPGLCRVKTLTPLGSGQVLAIVGSNDRRGDAWSLSLYDPPTDAWSRLSTAGLEDTPPPYAGFSVMVLGSGRFLRSGGFTWVGGPKTLLAGAAEYDPATQTWTRVGSLNAPRADPRAVLLHSGNVLVLGGGSDTAEIYEPAKKTWTLIPPPPFTGTPDLALRLNSGLVMAVFGTLGVPTATVHLYDPYNHRWLAGPALPMEKPVNATLLYSGEVLVTNDAGAAALYDPAQGAWLPAASGASLSTTSSVLLNSGRVLRLGGVNYLPQGQRYTR